MNLIDRKELHELKQEVKKLQHEVRELAAIKDDADRFQWLKEHPAFESEAWLGSCTQAEYVERIDQLKGTL